MTVDGSIIKNMDDYIIENLKYPLIEIDEELTIIQMNKKARNIWSDFIVGGQFECDIFYGKSINGENCVVCNTIDKKRPQSDEILNGEMIYKVKTDFIENEKMNRVVIHIEDISDIKDAISCERDIKAIFDNVDVLLWSVYEGEDGYLYYDRVNEPFASVAGKTPDDYYGKKVKELGRGYEAIRERYERMKREKEIQIYERSVDDGEKEFVVRLIPILGPDGEVHRFIGSAVDITYRKEREEELKRSEEKFRNLFQYANDAIFVVSLEGEILAVNRKACELHNFTEEEMLDLRVTDLVPEEVSDTLPEVDELLETEGSFVVEAKVKRKDGFVFPTEVSGRLVPWGEGEAVLVFLRDITERNRVEQIESVLYIIANSVNTTENLNDFFESIHHHLNKVIDTKNSFIALYDEETDSFNIVYDNIVDEELNVRSFPARKSITNYMIKKDEPILLKENDLDELINSGEVELIGKKTKSWLGIPLKIGGKVLGALAFLNYYDEDVYTVKDMGVLRVISEQIAIAVEKNKSEEKIKESEEKFRNIFELSPTSIILLNKDGDIIDINNRFHTILGYSKEEILGKNLFELSLLTDQSREKVAESFRKRISGKVVPPYEIEFIKKDGERGYGMVYGNVVTDNDEVLYGLGVISEITELKRKESELKSLLNEKEVLLKEIHHRVKNNLQVISSILNIQSNIISDEEMQAKFRESQERINSIALIHDRIYTSKDLSRIELKSYISDLSESLFNTYRYKIGDVKLQIDAQDVLIGVNKAIPVALIVNELITNSLKYAFPDKGDGEIYIKLYSKDNDIILIVGDNGIGMPEDVDIHSPNTIGLEIVNILVNQIDGEIQLDDDEGVEFIIEFDLS